MSFLIHSIQILGQDQNLAVKNFAKFAYQTINNCKILATLSREILDIIQASGAWNCITITALDLIKKMCKSGVEHEKLSVGTVKKLSIAAVVHKNSLWSLIHDE